MRVEHSVRGLVAYIAAKMAQVGLIVGLAAELNDTKYPNRRHITCGIDALGSPECTGTKTRAVGEMPRPAIANRKANGRRFCAPQDIERHAMRPLSTVLS